MGSNMFKYPCNGFIKQDLKLRVKNMKKVCFSPLKQCLSGHLMKFFNVKESKNIYILCTSSMGNHLKIEAQNRKNYDLDPCNYA